MVHSNSWQAGAANTWALPGPEDKGLGPSPPGPLPGGLFPQHSAGAPRTSVPGGRAMWTPCHLL